MLDSPFCLFRASREQQDLAYKDNQLTVLTGKNDCFSPALYEYTILHITSLIRSNGLNQCSDPFLQLVV